MNINGALVGEEMRSRQDYVSLSFLRWEKYQFILYADGKDPVEREKADDAGEKGKYCWSHVLE